MVTGLDQDNWRSMTRLAKAADRIADALERIATALEESAAWPKPTEPPR